jgi:hypothetical protein
MLHDDLTAYHEVDGKNTTHLSNKKKLRYVYRNQSLFANY